MSAFVRLSVSTAYVIRCPVEDWDSATRQVVEKMRPVLVCHVRADFSKLKRDVVYLFVMNPAQEEYVKSKLEPLNQNDGRKKFVTVYGSRPRVVLPTDNQLRLTGIDLIGGSFGLMGIE